jgi:hypothetical protein
MGTFEELQELLRTSEPAGLGPGPRAGVQPKEVLESRLAKILPKTERSGEADLIQALVFLWHDHLQASHSISQAIEGEDGAFVHGIMHRREPDYSNAAYWFRRVGRHGAFPGLAQAATQVLETGGAEDLLAKLLRKEEWDPFGFVEACEDAAESSGNESRRNLLRRIQQAEFEVLLAWFWKKMSRDAPPGKNETRAA